MYVQAALCGHHKQQNNFQFLQRYYSWYTEFRKLRSLFTRTVELKINFIIVDLLKCEHRI